MNSVPKKVLGEIFASFCLSYFGLGTLVSLVVYQTMGNTFEFGIFFGLLVAIIIAITNPICGAHFNPAVTVAMATSKRMEWKMVIPYIVAQVFGWWLGAMILYATFGADISAFEAANGIVRGAPESIATTGIFHCTTSASLPVHFFVEFMITAFLLIGVCAFIDPRNTSRPTSALFPLMIGFIVSIAIIFAGGITAASLNPARDLGPRIAAWMLGWGEVAFPGTNWYMYIIAPTLGGIFGAFFYDHVIGKCLPSVDMKTVEDTP